jgi:hypothetical protein
MEALLKIRADVQGEGEVGKLGAALSGLNTTATKVSGGLKGMLGSVGGLSGALGNLVPMATGAGLVALGKSAIDAADNMRDMAQKTGVSVEMLSRFQQAAKMSGTDINAVSGAMIKLNKNMATGDDKAAKALASLGISARDASGKLKSADAVMLEVADKFAKMPDGAQKSATAIALFGRSGADMIPMLNGGSKAIKDLSATMSTEFANSSDQFNDKIERINTKFAQLGVAVGTAIMPALDLLANAVTGIADLFTKLPQPIQAIIGAVGAIAAAFIVLAPAISAVISIAGALAGLELGAIIAGWAGAIGPAIAAISAAFTGLLAWLGGTFIPALLAFFSGPVGWTVLAIAAVVALCIAFREPIMGFLSWLWQAIPGAMTALGQALYGWFVQPWINLWEAIKPIVVAYFGFLGELFKAAFQTLYAIAWQIWVQPWINLWSGLLRDPVVEMIKWLSSIWGGISKVFNAYVVQPISKAWTVMIQLLPKAMQSIATFIQNVWIGMVNTVKNVMRGMLQFVANGINAVGGMINRLIGTFNALPGPNIPYVPSFSIPAFAEGGYVNRRTVGMVGEAGPEYIIPQSKMAAASRRYLSGARGASVIPTSGTSSTSQAAPVINITTGPVMQQYGQQWATIQDLERVAKATADGMLGRLRTPAARIALGIR